MPELTNSTASQCAVTLRDEFLAYNEEFRKITQRAKLRFEMRDWHGGQRDSDERVELYAQHIIRATKGLSDALGEGLFDHELWIQVKAEFEVLIEDLADAEFAKTYFSSVTRRLFKIVGVEPEIEFVGEETTPLRNSDGPLVGNNYTQRGCLVEMFRKLLDDYAWVVPYRDRDASAAYIASQVTEHYRKMHKSDAVLCVDMIGPVFYRLTRAYAIGRVTGWTQSTPIVIAFENTDDGIVVDAVIQTDRGVRVMFGFACSYFHVDLDPVGSAVQFLHGLMPRHMINELFTVLGRAKQGKTERYREFARHLRFSKDTFITAPGKKGMVMAVFTLPSLNIVFKLMRDRFAPPKNITHEEVRKRYRLVARSNKSGRLVDAQEFRMLRIGKRRFDSALLEELLGEASHTVFVDGDSVVFRHVYVERRLRPLDLYLREVEREDSLDAVIDYGNALRELAATNVFPGDLLTKNFGVSSTGRVIFYDYDEVELLSNCNFRDIPEAQTYEDEMSAEPWFSVRGNDIFPEEFAHYFGFSREQMDVFLEVHGELLTADYWRALQARHRAGEVIEVLPYQR